MSDIRPSEKQIHYAGDIARVLGIPLPEQNTLTAYATFISSHLTAYHKARKIVIPEPDSATDKKGKYVIQEVEPRLRLQNIKQRVSEEPLLSSEAVVKFAKSHMKGFASESILVFNMDPSGAVINFCRVSTGTLTQSMTSGREIFKAAILSNAAGILIVHNHVVDDPKPSQDDIILTNAIAQAGQILGIPLIDHIIITAGGTKHYSIADSNADLFGVTVV